ncbi:MAG TPA: class I SAM-dependent methyltransferase [Terriglobales bacterium]|nr:class I SAM-dependent methyltransferase [Terriglobales bacterium]
MLKVAPTLRFSSRVEKYVRHRPSYPAGVIPLLQQECGLTADSLVADIGSGTGIFTRLLLENGNRVSAVEPNAEMRSAGEEFLAAYPDFVSVAGTAEATTLASESVDLITCAQAAHWFDRERALAEFRRILKPGGFLVLLWNDRRITATGLGREYEDLITRYGTDYAEVKRRDQASTRFFGEIPHQRRVLPNYQDMDYAGLEGRLLSASYTPHPGDPQHGPMIAELRRIFDRYQNNGRVRLEYDTNLYFGRIHV